MSYGILQIYPNIWVAHSADTDPNLVLGLFFTRQSSLIYLLDNNELVI